MIVSYPHGDAPWKVTPLGIIKPGQTTPMRTQGQPVTLRRIYDRFSPSSPLIAALIATESVGDENAQRFEPALGDFSFGLCQTLTRTAWGLGCRTASAPLGHANCTDETLVEQWRTALCRPTTSIALAEGYCRKNDSHFQCGGDPVLIYAAFNAGAPMHSDKNVWGLVSYSDALDRFAAFYGDALSVLAERMAA